MLCLDILRTHVIGMVPWMDTGPSGWAGQDGKSGSHPLCERAAGMHGALPGDSWELMGGLKSRPTWVALGCVSATGCLIRKKEMMSSSDNGKKPHIRKARCSWQTWTPPVSARGVIQEVSAVVHWWQLLGIGHWGPDNNRRSAGSDSSWSGWDGVNFLYSSSHGAVF